MAAPDFPNAPTLNQTYTAPSGLVYTWDGKVWTTTAGAASTYWTDTGTALTPTDATKQVVIPGPTAGGTPQAQLVLGTRTMKGRVLSLPAVDWYGISFNRSYTGAGWVQDDATKPSWNAEFQWAADNFNIERQAPAGANVSLLTVDNAGNLTITGGTAVKASGTTWSNPSDIRLKQDVGPYTRGLTDVLRLSPITYRLKADPERECQGFDAAAVKEVFPECVSTTRMKLDPADEEDTEVF